MSLTSWLIKTLFEKSYIISIDFINEWKKWLINVTHFYKKIDLLRWLINELIN